jgi:CMD domain protein
VREIPVSRLESLDNPGVTRYREWTGGYNTMTNSTEPAVGSDTIDQIAGLAAGSRLAQLRAERPEVALHAEGSYQALLEPADPAGVSRFERESIALRVAVLTPSPPVAAWHRDRLRKLGATEQNLAAIERFPEGSAGLSAREVAILRHTDRLTLAPAAASPAQIAELKEVGLSPRDIVTIAQLITFETFQIRVLAGLRLLAEEK